MKKTSYIILASEIIYKMTSVMMYAFIKAGYNSSYCNFSATKMIIIILYDYYYTCLRNNI